LLAVAILVGLVGQAQEPVFRAEANLRTVAVRVTDKHGEDIAGLRAGDFTLLEDGRPQKIAFFGADRQPVSLAVLIDASTSMSSGHKNGGVREFVTPLLRGSLPEDEIFVMPFDERAGPFHQLTEEERVHPPESQMAPKRGGTAFYDAVATALCRLRTATNLLRAVVVITDGADQHSRLRMRQLIELARRSNPQVFMVGFYDAAELAAYRQKAVPIVLVTGQEVDNPLIAFDRLAKETGAEVFVPSSDREMQKALERIASLLRAQYTLAYYPGAPGGLHKIEVKVARGGARVIARRSVGSEDESEPVHFSSTTCEVSPAEHPYPWEPHAAEDALHFRKYREDFADPMSGWPSGLGRRYRGGSYELSGGPLLSAYGPAWENLRASVSIESYEGFLAAGLVFHLNEVGYDALLMAAGGRRFKLVRANFATNREMDILGWTAITGFGGAPKRIGVECMGGTIRVLMDGKVVQEINGVPESDGYVGFVLPTPGHVRFRDLEVEDLLN
jgi:Ca-activated chloride channel family protein